MSNYQAKVSAFYKEAEEKGHSREKLRRRFEQEIRDMRYQDPAALDSLIYHFFTSRKIVLKDKSGYTDGH